MAHPATWRKSSHTDETACVEVAVGRVTRIRDTKDRYGGTLAVPAAAWAALIREIPRPA